MLSQCAADQSAKESEKEELILLRCPNGLERCALPPRDKAVRSVSGILLYILRLEEVLKCVPDAASYYFRHLPSVIAPCRTTASRHNMISS